MSALGDFWRELALHLAGRPKSRRAQLVEAQARIDRQISIMNSGGIPSGAGTKDFRSEIAELRDVHFRLSDSLAKLDRLQGRNRR